MKLGVVNAVCPDRHVAPYAGAWIEICKAIAEGLLNACVAPYAGAWIEITQGIGSGQIAKKSLPTRERGLKYCFQLPSLQCLNVAPYAGAWIEIVIPLFAETLVSVAPYAGAWIEIYALRYQSMDILGSLPTRERGLKYSHRENIRAYQSRSLRGSVDLNTTSAS